jgi:hypothetical protein
MLLVIANPLYEITKCGFEFNILILESGDIHRTRVRYVHLLVYCDLDISTVSMTDYDLRAFFLPCLPSGYGLVCKFVCFIIRKAKATYPTIARHSPHEEPLEKTSTFAPYGNNITGI